ncbi:MAG TPA: hypothetical protein VF690_08725 [Hymenobacter sp.]
MTYTNTGSSTANSYDQTLSLTAGLGTVSFSNQPVGVTATYDNSSGAVTFTGTPNSLAGGANQNLTVNIAAVPGALTQVVTNSTVSSKPSGGPTTTNSASSTVTVTPVADVSTALTGPTTIFQSQPTSNFTATFTNNGPSPAASVTRTVVLPTGATLTTAQRNTITGAYPGTSFSTTGTGASAVTTINFGTVTNQASGSTASFVFAFTALAATGSVSATSNTSTTTNQNGATANDVSSLGITVASYADVSVTLTGPATITGNVATSNFVAVVTNNGPGVAASVTRVVTLPPGATMTATQISSSGGTYVAPASTTASGTLTLTSLATLNSGASSSSSFSFTPFNGNSSPVSTRANVTTTAQSSTANDVATVSSAVRFSPVPAFVTSASMLSTNGQTAISTLSATDQDGTIASYTIVAVPRTVQGVVLYNTSSTGSGGTYQAVTAGLSLTPAQAATLAFDPSGNFAGNVTFTYQAVDSQGISSTTATNGATTVQGAATFTIPVTSAGIMANNDSNVVPLNTTTTGNVLLNDINPETTGMSVTTTGSLTTPNGTYTYSSGSLTTPNGQVNMAANGIYT